MAGGGKKSPQKAGEGESFLTAGRFTNRGNRLGKISTKGWSAGGGKERGNFWAAKKRARSAFEKACPSRAKKVRFRSVGNGR